MGGSVKEGVLGWGGTSQQGSLVDAERPPPLPCLRFDFNLTRPMTPIEVAEVEVLVNGWVAAATPLQVRARTGM